MDYRNKYKAGYYKTLDINHNNIFFEPSPRVMEMLS